MGIYVCSARLGAGGQNPLGAPLGNNPPPPLQSVASAYSLVTSVTGIHASSPHPHSIGQSPIVTPLASQQKPNEQEGTRGAVGVPWVMAR